MMGEPLRLRVMKHDYTDRWFADPFILGVNSNQISLLVEEMFRDTQHSRISRLDINRETMMLEKITPVIDNGHNYSFPNIIKRDGDAVMVMPEMAEHGRNVIYKYFPNSGKCEEWKEYEKGKQVIDPVMFQGKCYFTELSNPNVGRSAGNFFEWRGQWYRPLQDCRASYGHGVWIEDEQHHVVRKLYSTDARYKYGLHTLNMYKDVIVTDVLGFKRPWLRLPLQRLYYLWKRRN